MDVSCPTFATLGSLIDGEDVSPDVRDHVASCLRCGHSVAMMKSLDGLLSPIGKPEPSAEFSSRLMAIPDQVPARTHRILFRLAPLAAAAVILLIAGIRGQFTTSAPEPSRGGGESGKPVPSELRGMVQNALASGSEEGRAILAELDGARLVILNRIALEDDAEAARAALLALAASGPRESLPAALAAVHKPDRRAEAVKLLAAIRDPKALPALEAHLPEAEHPGEVIDAIAAIGGVEAARILDRALTSLPSPLLRERAVMAIARADGIVGTHVLLGRRGDPELSSYVFRAIEENADALVPHLLGLAERGEQRAFDLLGVLGRPEAVPGLIRMLDRSYSRTEAARVLALTDTIASADALIRRWQHADIREAFVDAGAVTEQRLIGLLFSKQKVDQRMAIELLAICGGSRAIKALLPLARKRDLAPAIIATLGRIGGPEAVAALDLLAEIPRLEREAIRALGTTGDESAVPILVTRGREHRVLRGEAVAALGHLNSPAAVRAILTLEPDRRPKSATVRTLKSMDRGVVLSALASLLTGDYGPAARRALDALDSGSSPGRMTGNY